MIDANVPYAYTLVVLPMAVTFGTRHSKFSNELQDNKLARRHIFVGIANTAMWHL